jgi:probable addiction module antidote protein
MKIADLPTFEMTEHLTSDAEIAAYLTAVIKDGDTALLAAASDDIARLRGVKETAQLCLAASDLRLSAADMAEFATELVAPRPPNTEAQIKTGTLAGGSNAYGAGLVRGVAWLRAASLAPQHIGLPVDSVQYA